MATDPSTGPAPFMRTKGMRGGPSQARANAIAGQACCVIEPV